jgi:hypothetical protein
MDYVQFYSVKTDPQTQQKKIVSEFRSNSEKHDMTSISLPEGAYAAKYFSLDTIPDKNINYPGKTCFFCKEKDLIKRRNSYAYVYGDNLHFMTQNDELYNITTREKIDHWQHHRQAKRIKATL